MRKTREITVQAEGRDKGKKFQVTEMPAMQTERWAARALQGLASSGAELPEDAAAAGAAGLAALGFKALGRIEWPLMESLLAEMMACCQIVEPAITRALTADDVEEVPTLLLLRGAWFEMHFSFFRDAVRSLMPQGKTPAPATALSR